MPVPLPPLPPAPGDDEEYRPGGRSVVDLLAEEHARIGGLLRELADPRLPAQRRSQVAQVLTATVSRHLSAEEQYLYPAMRASLPDGGPLADREIAADTEVLRMLRDLAGTAPEDPRFGGLADDLGGKLRRHADAADREIFPVLREVATDAELIRLGNRVEIAEEAAPTRPHPGHPVSPPWNRVVEPALGVVDKVRDAVTGRRTYVEDLGNRPQPR
ncbi:hemerythrin domain-containing protein [Solwaraspora sp. WMMD1047]|uniref:hemerythrin domain-containing protein n=1 Tax=Solwaraspora sp. WMMD1047 TaxID=3016102 RepID=UPI0024173A05|nr:hemerythrin domain-containing protein [Solwaraspora sp. WMMD1047]MDG4831188.1 hemerythrin domain-containing protein [Solwaraspora sp. WMMD1047]